MKSIEIPNDVLFENVRQMLSEGRTVTMRVKGQSMRPFLEGGRDVVVLKMANRVEKGDMVLAEIAKGHFVLHRVLKVDGERITLMGDGNLKGTESCDKENVVGKVISVLRNEKTINCDSHRWRFYSALWRILLPVRRWLLGVYRKI